VGDKFKATLHGPGVAGSIENHIIKIAIGQVGERIFIAVANLHRGVNIQMFAAKIQTVVTSIQHRDLRSAQAGKNRRGHADRTGTDYQRALPGLKVRTAHRMGANGQEFDHCGLVQGHPDGLVDELMGDTQVLGKGTVTVHTQHLDARAAVGLALPTGDARTTRNVRHHVDHIARHQGAALFAGLDDAGKFVAHHPRVLQIRLVTGKDVQVGTAHTHAFDPDQGFTGATLGNRAFEGGEQAGFVTDHSQHFLFSVDSARATGYWRDHNGCGSKTTRRKKYWQDQLFF